MTGRSAVAIPPDLLEQVERGNVLLFIGERLARDPTGADELAAELAARAEIADAAGLSFPELAQAYEDLRGRQALVDLVARRLQPLGDAPLPAHRLIAGLAQCGVLASTDLSGRLERAFRDAGRPLQVVVRNEDIAFEDEGALARALLAELVTSQGTKAVRSADELALALDVHQCGKGRTLVVILEQAPITVGGPPLSGCRQ